MKNTRGQHSSPERRGSCELEQLSLDILALLASCGEPVRRTDLQAVQRVLDSLAAGSQVGGGRYRPEDLPQPIGMTKSRATDALSLGWRCDNCGRLRLFREPCPKPASCQECGSPSFSLLSPTPLVEESHVEPVQERRRFPRES